MVYQKRSSYKANQSMVDFEQILCRQLDRIGNTVSQDVEPGLTSIRKASTLKQELVWLETLLMPFITDSKYKGEKERLKEKMFSVNQAKDPEKLADFLESVAPQFGLLMAYSYNAGLVSVNQYDTSALETNEEEEKEE